MYYFLLITVLFVLRSANSALLLWTPKPFLFPVLKPFTSDDYAKLVKDLDNPSVVAFRTASLKDALKLQHVLTNNTNSVYLMKAGVDVFEDVVETQEITDETISNLDNISKNNTLIVLAIDNTLPRVKRKSDDNSTVTNEEVVVEDTYVPVSEPQISGPVLYTYLIDKKDKVMVYSSKPLLLAVEDATIYLGNASMSFIDVRESYTRLIARITTVNNRIIFLRFIFSMLSGYWYLNCIEVEINSVRYNLALVGNNNVTAPNHMSYHCEDQTTFTDLKSNISLYLYDLQTQPDAHNHRFGDAYNCIPFTTGPILSGLFVTSIMCIGLIIGLTALASIKTMDRFDTSRTKQLNITLFE